MRFARVIAVDAGDMRIALSDGGFLSYDRLILAPGIDLRFDAVPGYDEMAAERMPHGWKAGPQTELLRNRLAALEDGSLIVIAAPANPYRCPPGPYERASLMADYLKRNKPRSKILILDAKDGFSKQKLFLQAWETLYPGMIEWVPLSKGGKLVSVDAGAGKVTTEFESFTPQLANIIPPQRAGQIAMLAGAADQTGWSPIDPISCESRLAPMIHVIGDAAIAGGMPKSAFAANAQAKHCANAVACLLRGDPVEPPLLFNTCYSLVGQDYGISVAGAYRAENGLWSDIAGAGGVSPLNAPPEQRAQEAKFADGWFETITADIFA
jgi:NADPH-dependent 2,4-dienoyl-CoA reductase/sulfur reductase-like enzyme